jgi:hypothetical protein
MELTTTNRRSSPRYAVSKRLPAQLNINGQLFETTVINYGVTGVALNVPPKAMARVEKDKSDVEVTFKNTLLSGVVRHARAHDKGAILGVALRVEGLESEVSFTSDDPGWDLIENKETIDQIFGDLAFKGPEVQISVRQIQGQAILLAAKPVDKTILFAEIFETSRGKLTDGRASFQFEMFQTCHAFETRLKLLENGRVEIEIPVTLARLLRRETYRVRNGANQKTLTIRMVSETLGAPGGELRVYDYSEHGVSVIDPSGWACAPIGTPIETIVITTGDGKTIHGRGQIRGFRWVKEENACSVGVSFETSSDNDRTEWHNAILEARYPALSFTYSNDDHRQIWALFERSDYLHLKGPEAYTHVIDLTRKAWHRLAAAGTQWSKRAIIRGGERILGHIQMDRIYPETWCIHHLAIDPALSKLVAKELYGVTTDILLAEGGQYVLSFTEASKPWNQRAYYDFVRDYRFPDHNELKAFQIYEADLSNSDDLKVLHAVTVAEANKYDLQRISRYCELYLSNLERNACALTSNDLCLATFQAQLRDRGLERGRAIIAANTGTQFRGFARVETGTEGVNIVGILDILYVHVVHDPFGHASEIYETLVKHGLDKFRSLGKKKVLVALDDDRIDYYSQRGLKFVCNANRWIAKRDILPRYHAFSELLYGHLIARRAMIRGRRVNT